MKKISLIILFLIILFGFVARLYRFDNPISDWHSWRQADTSSVSREFIKQGFDILRPRYHDLSSIPSGGKDNPKGLRFVEFPIYNVFQAGLYLYFKKFTLEEWGRLVSILSQLISIVFLYLIVQKYRDTETGLLAAFFFSFLPFNIYYGRSILPGPLSVMALLSGIYFFDRWIESEKRWISFVLSCVSIISAVLVSPFASFFILPIMYLVWNKYNLTFISRWPIILLAIATLFPFLMWRAWVFQYPEGVPLSNWLWNGNNIRFKGAFFQWIFAERIGRMLLGYWGLPLVVIGVVAKVKKEGWFFFSFLIASLLFLTFFATGNVTHDYYQVFIVPTLAIFWSLGARWLLTRTSDVLNIYAAKILVVVSTVFMLMFGWYVIRDYYTIQHLETVVAGMAVDALTPKDAKVIAAYNGDTSFLYQTNRRGWPVFDRQTEEFIEAGASYLVFVNPTPEELHFQEEFKTVKKTESYVIFDLTQSLPGYKNKSKKK